MPGGEFRCGVMGGHRYRDDTTGPGFGHFLNFTALAISRASKA